MPWNKGLKIDKSKYPNWGGDAESRRLRGLKISAKLKGRMPKNLNLINANKKGSGNPMWHGGHLTTSHGYIKLWCPQHPRANSHGYYDEHRLIMERKLGRILLKEETVHHIDFNNKNNQMHNLFLFKNTGEHSRFHRLIESQKKNQSPKYLFFLEETR